MFQALPEDYKNPILIKMIEKKKHAKKGISRHFLEKFNPNLRFFGLRSPLNLDSKI